MNIDIPNMEQFCVGSKSRKKEHTIIDFPREMFTTVDETTLSCEASDMGNRHLQHLDSGDVGFAIKHNPIPDIKPCWCGRGPCSKERILFYRLWRTIRDSDGDIRFWEFRLMPYSHQAYPDWSYTFVMVNND